MLLIWRGLNPQPPDHQSDAHPAEPPRPAAILSDTIILDIFRTFTIKTLMVLESMQKAKEADQSAHLHSQIRVFTLSG